MKYYFAVITTFVICAAAIHYIGIVLIGKSIIWNYIDYVTVALAFPALIGMIGESRREYGRQVLATNEYRYDAAINRTVGLLNKHRISLESEKQNRMVSTSTSAETLPQIERGILWLDNAYTAIAFNREDGNYTYVLTEYSSMDDISFPPVRKALEEVKPLVETIDEAYKEWTTSYVNAKAKTKFETWFIIAQPHIVALASAVAVMSVTSRILGLDP